MDTYNHKPLRLREWRMHRWITQAELSEKAKVTQQTVSLLETDPSRKARVSTIRKLATALDVAPSDLYVTPAQAGELEEEA